jgi:hypothetical protein
MRKKKKFTIDRPVPPHALEAALAKVRAGGRLYVPTYLRFLVINAKTLENFEKMGLSVLREEGDGYRLRLGERTTIYLFPGQLRLETKE